jgi:hypothetical protein
MGFGYVYEINKQWNAEMKAREFKDGERVWLTEQGSDIVGTVGDQWFDL